MPVCDRWPFYRWSAANELLVREHAERGGFPADRVIPVARMLTPADADG